MAKFFVARRSCSEVHFATRASNLSQNFYAKLICPYELLDIMSSILDLKNPKNHKKNNSHSINDILDGDSPIELETEPMPIEPVKKYKPPVLSNPPKEENFLDNLETPEVFDRNEEIPNNAGDMTPFVTLTSAPQFPATVDSEPVDSELFSLEAASSVEPMAAEVPGSGLIAWTAPDKHHELISHTLRKWVIVILVAMAILAFFWQKSILTAITFFVLALVTSMHFWREAQDQQYEIHPHGVAIDGRFYHYHDLDSFWIHFHPQGYHELSLCTGRLLNHYIKVPLGDRDPFEIRDALMAYLPEERHEEGLEDWLRRKLGL